MELVRQLALRVNSAHKWFGNQEILRGLDLTVPQGCIYGLLGPSGCGKTTLFKCIVGRDTLDAGEIVVAHNAKGEIGYMPQDVCLYNNFSIKENCHLFAALYGLNKEDMIERAGKLACLLGIPFSDCTLRTLSGGQQRRVSLLITLLHNPKLLILDEPTVGLDPLLSHNIWQYFFNLTVNENKTIIVTTHYIEEARQAHKIGLMREGRLLAEECPTSLLEAHRTDSLEEVFLNLCQPQTEEECQRKLRGLAVVQIPKSPLIESSKIKLHRVKAQSMKSLYWLKRNFGFFVGIQLLPIIQCILVILTVGPKPKDLHVGYVNEEMNASQCSVATRECLTGSYLSSRFLNTITKKGIILDEFETVEDGLAAVRRNIVWGLMHFSSNYSACLINRIELLTEASSADMDFGEVHMWLDMSDQILANIIIQDIYSSAIQFLESFFEDRGWPPAAAGIPVTFEKAVYGSNNTTFTDFTITAFTVIGIFCAPILYTTSTLLEEKSSGVLDRNIVAGLNVLELLLSHVLIQMSLVVVVTLGTNGVNYWMFDHTMIGSWVALDALLVSTGFQGMCYGILLAAFCQMEVEATAVEVFTFIGIVFSCGCMWPIEGMHWLLRLVAQPLPLTSTIDAYRSIGYRGWSIHHPKVYLGFLYSTLWSAVFLVLAAVCYRWNSKIRRQ